MRCRSSVRVINTRGRCNPEGRYNRPFGLNGLSARPTGLPLIRDADSRRGTRKESKDGYNNKIQLPFAPLLFHSSSSSFIFFFIILIRIRIHRLWQSPTAAATAVLHMHMVNCYATPQGIDSTVPFPSLHLFDLFFIYFLSFFHFDSFPSVARADCVIERCRCFLDLQATELHRLNHFHFPLIPLRERNKSK